MAVVSSGIGGALNVLFSFVPVIFCMFFALSILEDSGYMARAAFLADRFMRALGLPVHVRLRLRLRARDERIGEQHRLRGARQAEHTHHEFVTVGEHL